MKQVKLVYNVEVDNYNQEENYFGEIVALDNAVIFDHYKLLKSFAFREDMVSDLNRKCAEYGYEVVEVIDNTFVSSYSEEI